MQLRFCPVLLTDLESLDNATYRLKLRDLQQRPFCRFPYLFYVEIFAFLTGKDCHLEYPNNMAFLAPGLVKRNCERIRVLRACKELAFHQMRFTYDCPWLDRTRSCSGCVRLIQFSTDLSFIQRHLHFPISFQICNATNSIVIV